ncbi:MAG: hypothetical protein GXO07_01980, partial [Crenarchaeota archaeon]|nr:hypothetical protein [Thermoproteota archaeon]
AFILTGFLSLADSVAATLFRRPDSSGKPSKFVEKSLRERGLSLAEVEAEAREAVPEVEEIARRVFK